MFKVDALSASYGANIVLQGAAFEIGAHERVGIFGHNGSGKSTLLRSLIGDVPMMSGSVTFGGAPIGPGRVHDNVQLGIGFVPQSRNVFPTLSVAHCLRIAGLRAGSSADDVYALFPLLGTRRRQRAGSLSGGEQQMLAIAMALMTRPKMILLDEPTAGLAPAIAAQVLDDLAGLNRRLGTGLVIIEQNVGPALAIIDRAIILRNGRIVFDGASARLATQDDLWTLF